jgi:hypothetical protein
MKNVLDGLLETIKKLTKRVERLETQQHKHPIWNLGTPTELTIAGGIITRTRSNHTVDTQADAATDDLDTISGGVEGDLLLLRAANSARSVVLKDGTGNLRMPADMTLDHADDVELLYYDGTNWLEITGSSNT